MNKRKKIILVVILLAVLLMGIGYAALANVTLTINCKATATVDQENFKVYFTGENTKKSDETGTNVDVTVAAKANTATVNFSGLTKKDDEKFAILEIINDSNDVDAESITVAINSTEATANVIEATAIMCDSNGDAISDYSVLSGSKTYVKVSAKLLQTPTEDVESTLTATITAVAKEVN